MQRHDAEFSAKEEEIEQDDTLDDAAKELALLRSHQEHARGIGVLLMDMESKIFEAFKKYNAQVYTLESVEDDLRKLESGIEKNAEALENALDNERNAKLKHPCQAG